MRSLTVMSANVQAGGVGRDRTRTDRFNRLLKLLAGERPDVLGVQEALYWDEPGTFDRVRDTLEMDGYVTRGGSDMRTALFVRPPLRIVGEPLELTGGVWRHGAVRVVLATPEGHRLTFGSAHLSVASPLQRLLEVEQLFSHFSVEGSREMVCILADTNIADRDADMRNIGDRGRGMLCYPKSSVPDVRPIEQLHDLGYIDLAARTDTTRRPTTVDRVPALRPDRQLASRAYAACAGHVALIDSGGCSDHNFLWHSLHLADARRAQL